MNLPALEGDIILNDKGSPAFTKLEQSSTKAGKSLDQIQAKADRVAASLTKLDRAGGTGKGIGGAFANLPTGDLSDLTDGTDGAADAATRLKANLEALGPAPVSSLQRHFRYLGEDVDDLLSRTNAFQKELEATSAGGGKLANALLQAGDAPFLRRLPIGDQAEELGNLLTLLPRVSAGTLALAGGLGAVAVAGYGAYQALDGIVRQTRESEISENIKDRLVPKVGDVDAAVAEIQRALHERISDEDALTFLMKIDASGPLAEIGELGQVAQTVQRYSDAFGQDWRKNLDLVTQAVQEGNGKLLEEAGIISDAEKAYLDYANAIGKTVPLLDSHEQKEALVQAVLKDNADLTNKAPGDAEQLAATQERLAIAFHNTKGALAEWAVSLISPESQTAISWWNDQLAALTDKMSGIESHLDKETSNARFEEKLPPDKADELHALRNQQRSLDRGIVADEFALAVTNKNPFATDEMVKVLEDRIAKNQAESERIQKIIDQAEKDFEQGKPVDFGDPIQRAAGKDPEVTFVEPSKQIAPADQALKSQADAQKELLEARAALAKNYTDEIAAAQNELAAANEKLATSEAALSAAQSNAAQGSNLQQQLTAAQAELNSVQNQIDAVTLRPRSAQLTEQSGMLEDNVEQAKSQVELLKEFIAGQADFSAVQAALDTNQRDIMESIAKGYTDLANKLKDERGKLSVDNVNAVLRTEQARAGLVAQGVEITGETVEDQALNAQLLLQEAQKRLTEYQASLQNTEAMLADVDAKIKEVSSAPAGLPTAEGADLVRLQSELTKRKEDLTAQIAGIQAALGQIPATAPGTTELLAAERDQADAAQGVAEARAKLLEAERQFVASNALLRGAVQTGNAALIEQALVESDLSQENYKLALSQAQAAGASTDLSDAAKKLPASFDEILNGAEALRSGGISPFDEWRTRALAIINSAKEDIKNTKLEAPQLAEGPGAPALPDDQLEKVDAATAAQNAAAQSAGGVLAPALGAVSIAYDGVTSAMGGFFGAMAQGLGLLDEAAAGANNAAQANMLYIPSFGQLTQAQTAATAAAVDNTVAINNSAQAYQLYVNMTTAAAATTEDSALHAGRLYDATTNLPVAFDTAGLSGEALEQRLRSLVVAMQNLEAGTSNAGFSIAQRLVPALGLSGSLQQAQKWTTEAQQVRQAIERENAEMLASGRDPFGVELTAFAMDSLQQRWGAQANDILTHQQEIANGANEMANATAQAAERMNSALDGIISGVLQDSTKGLLPLDDLLPREDAVDEPARRMADVAVKGFQSPWFEGLKHLFPDDIMSQGDDAIKRFAAEMVRGHQEGLTTALYDVDAAAAKVIEKIEAKQNQDDLIAQVREKVKGMADASDLDIMEALGIDTGPERMSQAATAMTVPIEELLAQIGQMSEGGGPLAALLTPDEATTEGVQQSGRDAIALAGEAMVSQAGEGAYGSRAITAIVGQLTEKEKDMKGSGKKLGEWLGTGLLDEFKENVPKALLDILVTELVPLMGAAAKADKEREAGTGTQ